MQNHQLVPTAQELAAAHGLVALVPKSAAQSFPRQSVWTQPDGGVFPHPLQGGSVSAVVIGSKVPMAVVDSAFVVEVEKVADEVIFLGFIVVVYMGVVEVLAVVVVGNIFVVVVVVVVLVVVVVVVVVGQIKTVSSSMRPKQIHILNAQWASQCGGCHALHSITGIKARPHAAN